ncbi:peptide deformylase [Kitasatospora sp. NPDC004669]|uniref:peptide deformylase n=1 Tax=Kitasatospora sp. NPDC004669 TaxID=3154555 RepID=UPI0033A2AF34
MKCSLDQVRQHPPPGCSGAGGLAGTDGNSGRGGAAAPSPAAALWPGGWWRRQAGRPAGCFPGRGTPCVGAAELRPAAEENPVTDVDLRLFVFDCLDEDGVRHVGHIANPVLDQPDPATRRLIDDAEGCLSVPGADMVVPRTARTTARGFDKDGNPLVIEGKGYFARCLQHETDHLEGQLYLDRLSKRDRKDALRQTAERREAVFARRTRRAAELDS